MDINQIKTNLETGNAKWVEFIQFYKNLGAFLSMVKTFKAEGTISIENLSDFFDKNLAPYSHLLGEETGKIGVDYFDAFAKAKELTTLL